MNARSGLFLVSTFLVFALAAPQAPGQTGPETWETMDFGALTDLAKNLAAQGDEGAAERAALAAFIEDKYIDGPAGVGAGTCEQWKWTVRSLRREMPEASRALLATVLRGAYGSPTSLAGMPGREVAELGEALRLLNDPGAGALLAQIGVSRGPEVYAHYSSFGMIALATELKKMKDAGRASRVALADFLISERLKDPQSALQLSETGGVTHWRLLAQYLSKDLAPERQADWAARLRAVYGSADALARRSYGEVESLVKALEDLGDPQAKALLAPWIENVDTAEAPVGVLVSLVRPLREMGEAGRGARANLIGQLTTRCVSDPQQVWSIGSLAWQGVVRALRDEMPTETRKVWAEKLSQAFAGDPTGLGQLGSKEVGRLVGAIKSLDPDEAPRLAAAWFRAGEVWKTDARPGDVAGLAALAAKAPPDETPDVRGVLTELETRCLANGEAKLETGTCHGLARAWKAADDLARARQWGMRAHEAALGTEDAPKYPGIQVLGPLGHLMNDVALTRPGTGYLLFARALARLAAEEKLSTGKEGKFCGTGWERRKVAYPLATPEARAILQAELRDAAGKPRLEVARVLARSYRYTREGDIWTAFVDKELASAGDDTKAVWMLIKGDAEALAGQLSPSRAHEWIERAVATAPAPEFKELALRMLIGLHREMPRGGGAVQGLERLKPYFDQSTQALVTARQQAYQEASEARRDVELARRHSALLRHLQERLDEARTIGDEDRIRHYKDALERQERRMAETEEVE